MHLIDQELNLMLRGRFDEAWTIAEELERLHPDCPRARFNRGWFLINQGKFQEGYQCLESGRLLNVYGLPKLETNRPLYFNQDLTDKILLINLESGYGDQILSSRFATDAASKGSKVIMACRSEIKSVFSRIPGCYKTIEYSEISYTRFDYWLPGFSCGWVFKHTFETLPKPPYIFPLPEYIKKWEKLLKTSKKYKVGIRWSGSPTFEHQQFRLFPANLLINLHLQFPEIQFYSLQRDNDLRELPNDIVDLSTQLETWEDTAGCIKNLDLVISSCTSIAHLSGAMDHPTWVIVPILPYHVWANGQEHSPWYTKNTIVFRQTEFNDWTFTFQKIYEELRKKFS